MKFIKELWQYREMIVSLVKRDLKSRYKGSILGFLWMFLNPLLQLCVYTIVFSGIMRMDIEKYYLFLFVALVPWIFFSTCLSGGTTVIFGQQDMVKKNIFPKRSASNLICYKSVCEYAFKLCRHFSSRFF